MSGPGKPGPPALVETPEEFWERTRDYFDTKEEAKERPTISGLMMHLGFASKQSFYDYRKRDAFARVSGFAHLMLEEAYEKKLDANNYGGAIFALKQLGWTDQHTLTLPDAEDFGRMIRDALDEADERTGTSDAE